LIIDGQQRLTALYSVFRGVSVKDDNYEDRKITIAFNPLSEEFKVADASTERNSEFINDITNLLTKTSTRTFINDYLEHFKKEKGKLRNKYFLIIKKLQENEELNKDDVELLEDRIQLEEYKDIAGKLGFREKENIEEEDENEEDKED